VCPPLTEASGPILGESKADNKFKTKLRKFRPKYAKCVKNAYFFDKIA